MSFEFETVDPQSVRDEVVNFFWEHRKWPGETREDYYDIWDWRYSSLSEGPAFVHIARLKETGQMVGHIGVYRRTFRFGDVTLSAGVPGNLFAHPEWQKTIVGVRLVTFLRSLVQRGELDAIIGFGNETANGCSHAWASHSLAQCTRTSIYGTASLCCVAAIVHSP